MPHVRYFAAAAEAAGTSAENVDAATLGDLLATMKKPTGRSSSASCSGVRC